MRMGAFFAFGIIWLFSVIWVIVDCASRRGIREGKKIAWILIALLFGIVGALLYYAVSYPKKRR